MGSSNNRASTNVAAIDAGSNGMRLAIGRIDEDGELRELEDFLAPFRGSIASLVKAELKNEEIGICVGTGGNLECLGRLRVPMLGKNKVGKVKVDDLDKMIDILLDLTPTERASRFELRPDRADVIAIAAIVLRMILRDAGVSKVVTPPVGLAQGLLLQLAARVRAGN